MGARLTRGASANQDATRLLRAECDDRPRAWSNGPGDHYGAHTHAAHKILYCVEGSITFHTNDGEFVMHAGDRLDLEPGTEHAARVGPEGVACVEAYRG